MKLKINERIVSLMKRVPQSLERLQTHPNRVMIFLKMNLVVVSLVQFLNGVTSSHLVRYSIVVIMYSECECHAN